MDSPASIDAALADLQWLRGLAAVLALDADDADDLVQETLVAAWSKPPSEAAGLRPWLASVLRNRFRMLRRGRARCDVREQSAPPTATSVDPEDTLQRFEALRLLVDELEALSADDRMLVVRRFFDGESAAEIARTLDLPAATVRSRIHRSLQHLRQRLDSRFGARRAWCTALGLRIGDATFATAVTAGIVVSATLAIVATLVWAARPDRPPPPREAVALASMDEVRDPTMSRRTWEDRRTRIRQSLPSAPAVPTTIDPGEEARSERLIAEYRELVDLCLEDLGSAVNGAISLDIVEIGSPDVGAIYESVDVVASTIRDPELEQCIVESMYAFVGDGVVEPYERKSTLTSQIGDSEDPALEMQRRFDAIVGAHVGEVSYCERQSRTAVQGTLPVRASIVDGGVVSGVVVGENALPNEFVECTVRAMKRWKFPPDLAGRELEYVFTPPTRKLVDD